jgi:hypothetical protein
VLQFYTPLLQAEWASKSGKGENLDRRRPTTHENFGAGMKESKQILVTFAKTLCWNRILIYWFKSTIASWQAIDRIEVLSALKSQHNA